MAKCARTSSGAPRRKWRMAAASSGGVCVRAIHIGKLHAQAAQRGALHHKSRTGQLGHPFGNRVIAHMRGVAQQFHGLQMRIEHARRGRHRVDEHRQAARLQHAPRLAQTGREILPVMRGKPAQHDIEHGVGEGQMLCWRLPGFRYCPAPSALYVSALVPALQMTSTATTRATCGASRGSSHGRRRGRGPEHGTGMAGDRLASDLVEIRPLRVHGAGYVVGGTRQLYCAAARVCSRHRTKLRRRRAARQLIFPAGRSRLLNF